MKPTRKLQHEPESAGNSNLVVVNEAWPRSKCVNSRWGDELLVAAYRRPDCPSSGSNRDCRGDIYSTTYVKVEKNLDPNLSRASRYTLARPLADPVW